MDCDQLVALIPEDTFAAALPTGRCHEIPGDMASADDSTIAAVTLAPARSRPGSTGLSSDAGMQTSLQSRAGRATTGTWQRLNLVTV